MTKNATVSVTSLIVSLLFGTQCFSQNINSPYSVYGIGDIDAKSYGRTSGMASTGTALLSSSYIINTNPASIIGLERSFFVINAATAGRFSTYLGDPITTDNKSNQDFWVKGFSLGVKINKFWAINVGFGQFSNVSYKFSGSRAVEGSTNVYTANYEGEGGLNDYYWTNAISIGKHFSLGIKSSLLAGPISQSETIYDDNLQTTIVTKQRDYFGDLRFQYGGLYKTAIGKKWDLSIGGKYTNTTRLSSQREITVLQDETSIVEDKFIKNDRFLLPNTYTGGIALTHSKKTTFTADYTHEDWSALSIKGDGWKYIDNKRLSTGVEFSKQQLQQWNLPAERKFYQLGAFINNSYLQVKGKQINEYGFTAGMGGRLGNELLYTLSGEFGIRGRTDAKLIKENYFQFTFSLSYRDFLFSKGRKYN